MRMLRVLLLVLPLAAFLSVPSSAAAQKVCKKGKPCGNTCIAKDKMCRVGQGTAQAATLTNSRASLLPSAKVPPDARFVASSQGRVYYWIGCEAWKDLKKANLIFFATQVEAERAGYRPSRSKGCAGPPSD